MSTDTSPAATAAGPRTRRARPFGLVLLAASLPMFMATLDNLVMTNALPVLHEKLGASVEQLQWFVNAYTLAFAGTILLASALGDRLGRRRIFLIGIAVFGIGSTLAALSSEPWQLIAARAIQGFGGAAVMPLSLALVAGAVRPERRPLAIGIWGGVSGLGVALGPLVGGAVMEGWNWQAIFWINVPVAIISIPLALIVLTEVRGRRERLDVPGVLLAGVGVLALVHAIVRGNDDGWDSLGVIAELVLAAALLVAFVVRQHLTTGPMMPLRLFRDRSFSVVNVVGFAFSFGSMGAVFILIQFLQVVQGSSPFEAALQTTPWTLAPVIVAPLAGIFGPRIGTRALIVAGMLLQGVALLWIASVMSADVAYLDLVAPFIVAGVGMALVFAPSSTALLATLVDADHAKASGVNSTVREIGVALGIAVLTAIFTGAGGELTPTGYVAAAQPAVITGAAVLLAAALIGLVLPSGRARRGGAGAAGADAGAAGDAGEAGAVGAEASAGAVDARGESSGDGAPRIPALTD
ncbi:MFS transporter [Schumannella sp. 10F1B-5-1]|uniref:MFS transporter n=1 Tax=Schumannella sp. 10F1B-5-1 TaxID=2590780 RepID=UPI001131F821|nr:MFS transporter [Schumannella sp. 10F1B-5-1]TPW78495.1 MFS transporter [Schumannella sp. 10F1B-5-1]